MGKRLTSMVFGGALIVLASCGGTAPVQGTVSGGGGFNETNASKLLKKVSSEFASGLRRSSPGAFGSLPQGWSQETLATVIEKVREAPTEHRIRDGHELQFDYQVQGEQYIVALAPFYSVYGSIPSDSPVPDDVRRDIQIKLLHESSHLWGLGEQQANQFSESLRDSLDKDMVYCFAPELHPDKYYPDQPAKFIANRESGLCLEVPGIWLPVTNYIDGAFKGGVRSKEFQTLLEQAHSKNLWVVDGTSDLTFSFRESPSRTNVKVEIKPNQRGSWTYFDGKTYLVECKSNY